MNRNELRIGKNFQNNENWLSWNRSEDFIKERIEKSRFVKDIRKKLKKSHTLTKR